MHDTGSVFTELFNFCPFIKCSLQRLAQVTNNDNGLFRGRGVFDLEFGYYLFGLTQHPAKMFLGNQKNIFWLAVVPNGCNHCHVV